MKRYNTPISGAGDDMRDGQSALRNAVRKNADSVRRRVADINERMHGTARDEFVGDAQPWEDLNAPQVVRKHADDNITTTQEGTHHDAILFVRGVLTEAISRGASDVHIEPVIEEFRIRFRVDGALQTYTKRPMAEYSSVLNGVKVLTDLDIATHQVPQDGHVELALEQVAPAGYGGDDQYYDIRVSVFPSVNGEVIVMRILNRKSALLSMAELGMDKPLLEQMRTMLLTNYGMMLVTGPTGSGKTTTLYSILSELKSVQKNIITLEDPIEFHLDWLRQCEINDARGFTYERAMASVLRQDPDVLMVGEIRDQHTAEYAVRSALVGRIVGSTIHANTAIGTIARLLELSIPRSILAHSINGIIAQRLVRRTCDACKERYAPSALVLAHLGLQTSSGTFYRGKGCNACGGTGFKGRTGIFSVMLFDENIRALIFDQRSLADVQSYAIEHGMRTLKMDAATKVLAGVTTVEEAVSVV